MLAGGQESRAKVKKTPINHHLKQAKNLPRGKMKLPKFGVLPSMALPSERCSISAHLVFFQGARFWAMEVKQPE